MKSIREMDFNTKEFDEEYLIRLMEVKKTGRQYLKHAEKIGKRKYNGSIEIKAKSRIALDREIVTVKERIEANNYGL